MILREISLAKNNLVPLDEFEAIYEGDETMLQIAQVFREYEDQERERDY